MLVELDPGVYTAIFSGKENTTGIALVGIYEAGANLSRLLNISSQAFVGTQSDIQAPSSQGTELLRGNHCHQSWLERSLFH